MKDKNKEVGVERKSVLEDGALGDSTKDSGDDFTTDEKIRQENKVLIWVLVSIFVIFGLVWGIYHYSQSQIYFDYKGIEFEAVSYGDVLFYETTTLLEPNDGTLAPFGFRIRTSPNDLKKIQFEGLDGLKIMQITAYNFEDNKTFNCNGDGVISIPNIDRLFTKIGGVLTNDPDNLGCYNGTGVIYNHFSFVYGNKTEIKKLDDYCYEVRVKGNDESCEILPAMEKLMVEYYIKYRDLE